MENYVQYILQLPLSRIFFFKKKVVNIIYRGIIPRIFLKITMLRILFLQ